MTRARTVAFLGTSGSESDLYARLSAVKSGEGGSRLSRHAALWRALGPDGRESARSSILPLGRLSRTITGCRRCVVF